MIRQICPHCLQTVELPDSSAGTVANCPRCRELIPVPAAYAPSVDPSAGPAAPPPGYRPSPDPNLERSAVPPSSEAITLDRVDRTPPPPGLASPRTGAASYWPGQAAPSGYTKTASLVLTPQGLAWIPAGCLTFLFLLTFFDWAGSFPGGERLYSQTAWESMVRGYSANPIPDVTAAEEPEIRAKMRTTWWMWLYMPAMGITLLAVWAERLLFRKAEREELPGELQSLWPHRFAFLSGAAGLMLLLLLFQSALGFGLETAIRRHVDATFAAKEAAADTAALEQKVEMDKAKMINSYGLRMTTARQLAIAANVVALAALLGRWWLDRRGPTAAPPRVLVQY